MKWKLADIKTRLYLIAAIILLAGLGSSALIFLTAGGGPAGESAGGDIYLVRPEDSKMYRHDLEVYGGKANVLMDEFMRWFAGLWHGKQLALTITCITVVISLAVFYIARHWSSDSGSLGGDDKRNA
jgi:hypothetical protein